MNKTLLTATRVALRNHLAALDAVAVGCRSCTGWSDHDQRCTRFEAVPPPDVQAAGCDEWERDGVPF